MNQDKYRKILAKVIAENIGTFDSGDLFYEFTETKELRKKINNMYGDVDTNPEIAKLEKEGILLVEQSIRNLQSFIKQELPLWIISSKETNTQ